MWSSDLWRQWTAPIRTSPISPKSATAEWHIASIYDLSQRQPVSRESKYVKPGGAIQLSAGPAHIWPASECKRLQCAFGKAPSIYFSCTYICCKHTIITQVWKRLWSLRCRSLKLKRTRCKQILIKVKSESEEFTGVKPLNPKHSGSR